MWRRINFEAGRPKRPFLGILGSKTYRKTITGQGHRDHGEPYAPNFA